MELIPVVDLMGGVVVRARRGERAAYRPIETPLCAGARPLDIAGALLELAPFRTLYIADLDAIRRVGGNDGTIASLRERFPAVDLWVDAGESDPAALERRRQAGLGIPVIGTEVLRDAGEARAALASGEALLSLDHDAAGRLGPPEVHEDPGIWPERIIVMTLARVGAGEGPDLDRLAQVRARAGARRIFAAGGVRSVGDVDRLAEDGIAGVLIASALHDGRLSRDDLARLTR